MTVTLRPGRSWEVARERDMAEIAAIAREGVITEELTRVQNGRLAGFIYALDNVGGFGGVADRLNAYNVYLGDPGRITTDLRRYQDVRPDDLACAADRPLSHRQNRHVRLVVQPPADRRHISTARPVACSRQIRPQAFPLSYAAPNRLKSYRWPAAPSFGLCPSARLADRGDDMRHPRAGAGIARTRTSGRPGEPDGRPGSTKEPCTR